MKVIVPDLIAQEIKRILCSTHVKRIITVITVFLSYYSETVLQHSKT